MNAAVDNKTRRTRKKNARPIIGCNPEPGRAHRLSQAGKFRYHAPRPIIKPGPE